MDSFSLLVWKLWKVEKKDFLFGVLISFFVAVIINLPLWYALVTTHEWSFNDIVAESSDELFYLARIQEVVDGHPQIGNPIIFERKDQKYPLGNLWENIAHFPISFFGWRLKTLSIVSDALLPFLLVFLTWYAFRYVLIDRRWRALAIGFIYLGSEVFLWKRPISPQAITILPVLWLLLFLHYRRDTSIFLLLRSMLIGIMMYSYPFHWTYAIVAEAVLWLYRCFDRQEKCKKSICHILLLTVPFLLFATPWILQTLTFIHDPTYSETMSRLGMIERHLPVGPFLQIQLLACIIGFFIFFPKEHRKENIPLLSLLFAGLLVLWQPLFTGREAEFASHYRNLLLFPLSLTSIVYLSIFTQYRKLLLKISLLCITVIISWTTVTATIKGFEAWNQTRLSDAVRKEFQETIQVLDALPPEQVILTENSFSPKLVAYTRHYPFAFYDAYMYLASDKEIIERAHIYNILVPYERIAPRGVFGTRYENIVLYQRVLCLLDSLISMQNLQCKKSTSDLVVYKDFENLPKVGDSEILQFLATSQVRYVLLQKPPMILQPYLQKVATVGDGRVLYLFSLPR